MAQAPIHRRIIHKVAEKKAKLDPIAPHAEHVGFVAYALCEVTALHWAIYLVSAYLLFTGLWVIVAKLDQ